MVEVENICPSLLLNLRADVAGGTDYLELVSSIRRHGLIQPIVVRPERHGSVSTSSPSTIESSRYEIVCGHRRYAACRGLNKRMIPSIVMDLDDQQAIEIALVENLQRRSLDPIEEAEGFKLYISAFGRGSISRLAEKIGKSEEYVSHRLLLLGLPKAIIRRISRRLLKPSEATELIWLKDEKMQLELADELVKNHLSFRKTRTVVNILRSEDTSVKEAVKRVLQSRIERSSYPRKGEDGRDGANDTALNRSVWDSSASSEDQYDGDSVRVDTINRAILVLRACLSGIDLIVERNRCDEMHGLLMKQRQTIHASLDEIVREGTKYKTGKTLHPKSVLTRT